ncbi:MAG: DUF2505 domain-containing protein [Pseudonocardia sp.]
MLIRHELKYDASPDEVFAMLADPAFREKVCRAQDVTSVKATVEPDGEGMVVRVDQTQPAQGIPGFAKKIVGDEIRIVQVENWSGSTHAALDVEIPGKPGHMKGTVTLSGDGSGTVETVDGEVKVNIPLIAGKLEGLIVELFTAAMKTEQNVGRAWLAGER